MLVWMMFSFTVALVTAIILKEIFEYCFYSHGKGIRNIYFIARLENDCTGTENIVRAFEKYAENFDTTEGIPKIIFITESKESDVFKELNLLKNDYINIEIVAMNEGEVFVPDR